MADGVVERVRRRFVKLHGGQVVLLWLAWAAIWWATRWLGLVASGLEPNVWIYLFIAATIIGWPVLFALTWNWFETRRPTT